MPNSKGIYALVVGLAFGLALSLGSGVSAEDQPPQTKWEYRVVGEGKLWVGANAKRKASGEKPLVTGALSSEDLRPYFEEHLNEDWGARGWELCSLREGLAVFKRPAR